jgi:hypothetical protein
VLTDGTRVPLRERAVFTAAWYLAEVLPNPPNPPSPWRGFLANMSASATRIAPSGSSSN